MPAGPGTGAGRRAYRSPRRARQAADTRSAVLAAAAGLFAERGWSGCGMREVAARAEVAVETVYAYFGSKPDLLRAVLDAAVVGDTDEIPLAQRPEFLALARGSPAERAAAAAGISAVVQPRVAPLYRALRQAAATDEALAARLRADEERRKVTIEQGVILVAGRPATGRERDVLWAMFSVEVWDLLVIGAGWTPAQYQEWLAETIQLTLGLPSSKPSQKGQTDAG